ncbi:MAG: cellulose binding domain-containing protein, partial [Actinoplanes sp.]
MQRSRLRLAIYASAALVAVGGGVGAAVAATNPGVTAAGSLTATFNKDSDWGSGYQARYTIKNDTGAAVNGWQLAFGLPAGTKLGSFWDATITTAGSTSTAKNPGYAPSIAAGATAQFGFIVAGSGAPISCTINGVSCAGGGATTAPTTAPTTRPTTAPPTTAPPTTAPTTRPPTTAPT